MWDTFKQDFINAGFSPSALYAISLTPNDRHPGDLSAKLDLFLRAIPSSNVTVVAFSMGGLVTRDYIAKRVDACQVSKVHTVVTLGTPHHGSDFGAFINEHEELKRLLR